MEAQLYFVTVNAHFQEPAYLVTHLMQKQLFKKPLKKTPTFSKGVQSFPSVFHKQNFQTLGKTGLLMSNISIHPDRAVCCHRETVARAFYLKTQKV